MAIQRKGAEPPGRKEGSRKKARSAGDQPAVPGRFKSFAIPEDDHLLTVLRYVERNLLRVSMAEGADRISSCPGQRWRV
jgi:hypothetical protein